MKSRIKSDGGVFLVEILIAMVILGVVGVVIFNSISSSNLQNKKTNTKATSITQLTSAAEVMASTPFLPCSAGNPNPYTTLTGTLGTVEIAAIYAVTSGGTWSYCTINNSYVSEIQNIEGVAAAWPTTENASRIQKVILREPSGLFRSVFKSFDNKLGNYGLGGNFKTIIQPCYNTVQVSQCGGSITAGAPVTNINLDVGVPQTFQLAVLNPKNAANPILYFSTQGSSNKYSTPSIEATINGNLLTILAPKFAANGTTKNTTGRGNIDIEAFDTVASLQATPIGLGISVFVPPFQAVIINPALTLIKNVNPGILQPVSYKGGFDPYTFANASTSALPAGLSFNSSTGTFSGTPTVLLSPASSYTVKFTDSSGESVLGSFTLGVVDQLAISNTVSAKTFTTGVVITAFNPFTTAGGVPAYSYSITPTLPAGLTFNTLTGQIAGTPTIADAINNYTVTVTDNKIAGYVGQNQSSTFSIRVLDPMSATAVTPKIVATGSAMSSYIPVTASGGASPYTYSVPSLPAGLTMNTSSGAITGTPTTSGGATTYTVTVKDSTLTSVTAVFSLQVVAQLNIGSMVAAKTFYKGTAITSFNPNSSPTGGITTYTYSITPALPAGLTYVASTALISGTPTVSSALTTYTLKITDATATGYVSQSDTGVFNLQVLLPLTATQSVASKVVATGSAMSSYIPVTASGGTSPYTYSVLPTPPAGLSFSTSSGAITGTPTTSGGATTYTVTVKDSTLTSVTAVFSLQVVAPLSISNQSSGCYFYVGASIYTCTPFTTTGGATPYTYSVSPALTNGLSIDTSTGVISGVQPTKLSSTSFTVTVQDASSTPVSKSATFNITILNKLAVTPFMDYILTMNTTYTNLQTVNVAGGLTPYTYSISSKPTWLTFNTSTGAISGTPNAKTARPLTITVTVNDSVPGQNNASSASFLLTVN